ncbi:hypothetical protein [Neptuniibacter sp. QD37_11]|uniref:hypothetical protein n=1 Tax=Neptuniibacter sp. QD37_11 TaxID=3398209 RepID=UPI0039F584F0
MNQIKLKQPEGDWRYESRCSSNMPAIEFGIMTYLLGSNASDKGFISESRPSRWHKVNGDFRWQYVLNCRVGLFHKNQQVGDYLSKSKTVDNYTSITDNVIRGFENAIKAYDIDPKSTLEVRIEFDVVRRVVEIPPSEDLPMYEQEGLGLPYRELFLLNNNHYYQLNNTIAQRHEQALRESKGDWFDCYKLIENLHVNNEELVKGNLAFSSLHDFDFEQGKVSDDQITCLQNLLISSVNECVIIAA